MSEVFNVRSAAGDDLAAVSALLLECNLPAEGVEEHLDQGYIVAEHEAEIIAVCGVEVYGPYGLMRSVAVSRPWRGKSIGRTLVVDRIAWAGAQGIRTLYLLTLDACNYFERFGFRRIDRDSVPQEIGGSCEFKSLCPETAVAMVKPLGGHG